MPRPGMTINPKAKKMALDSAKKRVLAIGFMVERIAKQLCPSDTGRLRASISTNWTGSGMERASTETYGAGETYLAPKSKNPYQQQLDTGNEREVRTRGNAYQAMIEEADSQNDGVGNPSMIPAYQGSDKFVVIVGTNVRYAPFIEFGTSKMDAQPFLVPAFYAALQAARDMGKEKK